MLDRALPKNESIQAIPRLHLFEFGDLNIPDIFHDLMTDILGHIAKMGLYDSIVPVIKEVIDRQDCSSIVDMCTGSGEPAILLQDRLSKKFDCSIDLVLTDKFPNQSKAKKLNALNGITYRTESVNATALPRDLKGLRTLFASLHHFKPEQVQAILQNAVDNDQPIAALEFTERTWTRIFFMIPGTLHVLAVTPFIKPFSFSRLFWTYAIPVMPAIYFWDGLVSNLRTYTVEELNAIVNNLENNQFSWEIKTIPTTLRPINVTYLIGQPKKDELFIAPPKNEAFIEKPIQDKNESKIPVSIPLPIAIGMLIGIVSYLSTHDLNISLAFAAFATLATGLSLNVLNSKPQYGRFFNSNSIKNNNIDIDSQTENTYARKM